MEGGDRPRHRRPPVVADQMELVAAQPVRDGQDVGDQQLGFVVLDALRPGAARVPTLVGRHRPELAVGGTGGSGVEDELPDGDLQPLELHERRR